MSKICGRPASPIKWSKVQYGDWVCFKSGPRMVFGTGRRKRPSIDVTVEVRRVYATRDSTVTYNLSDLRVMGVTTILREEMLAPKPKGASVGTPNSKAAHE